MRILAVCQGYPSSNSPLTMAFVHSRNVLYQAAGHEVEVLSFGTETSYEWGTIKVFPQSAFDAAKFKSFDSIVFHAPNLRNHLRILKIHPELLPKTVFVIHGTEWIRRWSYYPKVFSFEQKPLKILKRGMGYVYDEIKLRAWKRFLNKNEASGLKIIFVSNWIREQAGKCIGFDFISTKLDVQVVHNPIHPAFLASTFNPTGEKAADFVTLRPLDDSRHAIDVVCKIAQDNPDKTFHVFGKGSYFKNILAPKNISVFHEMFPQDKLPELLNRYRAALLPTRLDSQGVLMCEMASFGMPTLVSDIPICREMVGNFKNVAFISNDNPVLPPLPAAIQDATSESVNKFLPQKTVEQELRIIL